MNLYDIAIAKKLSGGGGGGESMLEQVTWTYEWDAVYETAKFIVEASYNDCASIIGSGKVPYFEITAAQAAEVNALVGYEWLIASKYVLTDMFDDEYNWVNFNMLGYIGYSISFNFSPATKTEYLKAS